MSDESRAVATDRGSVKRALEGGTLCVRKRKLSIPEQYWVMLDNVLSKMTHLGVFLSHLTNQNQLLFFQSFLTWTLVL